MKEAIHIVKAIKNWHVIRTGENFEKKVSEGLQRRHIEAFTPVVKTSDTHWNGTPFTVYAPIFPSMVFVRIGQPEVNTVLQTRGVINFLFWRNRYAVISMEDIEAIKDFCERNENPWIEKCRIPPVDFENKVDLAAINGEIPDAERQVERIYLNSLGYSMMAFVSGRTKVIPSRNAIVNYP